MGGKAGKNHKNWNRWKNNTTDRRLNLISFFHSVHRYNHEYAKFLPVTLMASLLRKRAIEIKQSGQNLTKSI